MVLLSAEVRCARCIFRLKSFEMALTTTCLKLISRFSLTFAVKTRLVTGALAKRLFHIGCCVSKEH